MDLNNFVLLFQVRHDQRTDNWSFNYPNKKLENQPRQMRSCNPNNQKQKKSSNSKSKGQKYQTSHKQKNTIRQK